MIVKLAVVAPAATVTVAGTVAHALFDESVTTSPLGPAALARVTVPVDDTLPNTEVGETVTLDTVASETVRVAVLFVVPRVAVIVAVPVLETAVVVTVKFAVVAP